MPPSRLCHQRLRGTDVQREAFVACVRSTHFAQRLAALRRTIHRHECALVLARLRERCVHAEEGEAVEEREVARRGAEEREAVETEAAHSGAQEREAVRRDAEEREAVEEREAARRGAEQREAVHMCMEKREAVKQCETARRDLQARRKRSVSSEDSLSRVSIAVGVASFARRRTARRAMRALRLRACEARIGATASSVGCARPWRRLLAAMHRAHARRLSGPPGAGANLIPFCRLVGFVGVVSGRALRQGWCALVHEGARHRIEKATGEAAASLARWKARRRSFTLLCDFRWTHRFETAAHDLAARHAGRGVMLAMKRSQLEERIKTGAMDAGCARACWKGCRGAFMQMCRFRLERLVDEGMEGTARAQRRDRARLRVLLALYSLQIARRGAAAAMEVGESLARREALRRGLGAIFSSRLHRQVAQGRTLAAERFERSSGQARALDAFALLSSRWRAQVEVKCRRCASAQRKGWAAIRSAALLCPIWRAMLSAASSARRRGARRALFALAASARAQPHPLPLWRARVSEARRMCLTASLRFACGALRAHATRREREEGFSLAFARRHALHRGFEELRSPERPSLLPSVTGMARRGALRRCVGVLRDANEAFHRFRREPEALGRRRRVRRALRAMGVWRGEGASVVEEWASWSRKRRALGTWRLANAGWGGESSVLLDGVGGVV
ncbi:MAG: hypothetical protein SGPRY_005803 [Prymnesium sp.]